MERQGPARRSVHIEAIRIRAKGLPDSTARGLLEGLGRAIAEALSAAPAHASTPGVDLGRIAAGGRSSDALRAEIASRIAASLPRPPASKA